MPEAHAADLPHTAATPVAPAGQGGMPEAAAQETGAHFAGRGAAATPLVALGDISGSLDWLLDLARQHAVDLASLSIRALVDQFVAALDAAREHVPLERRADWLVTAAWFVQLKSQLLLPDPVIAAQAEQQAAATRDRLVENARMQAAAAWLAARRPQLGLDVFPRGQPEIFGRTHTGDIVGLLRACLWLLRRPLAPPPALRRRLVLWRPPAAMSHIEALLSDRPEGGELLQFLPPHVRAAADPPTGDADPQEGGHRLVLRGAIASTLIAALELTRRGTAACDQNEGFGPVRVRAMTDPA